MPENNPLFEQLKALTTEQRNPRTRGIDLADTTRILELMNDEDQTVAAAVRRAIPDVVRAVELVSGAFRAGGRLFYAGAGTSGRLGILDAAECPPTFGVEPDLVQGIIAGGRDTVFRSREGVEDLESSGAADVASHGVTSGDVLVGIAASRRTPYVLGALAEAKRHGARTVFLRCNDGPDPGVDVVITVVVGPEAITGSTRLKSGTAQKMVLNMITTASMVKLGKVYENLMVDVQPNSEKLIERAKGIVMMLTGLGYDDAARAYDASGRRVKVAVVMQRLGLDAAAAEARVRDAGGFLARALGERE
ncbi:MAG TPA: N-acetylmuramic acid 6-phosphate etherase [Candidatus Krumholzibacteria bacterium]|nr:N-acetylmuramic acid 6-phosphate etherase [Candidatus Krumholzibacteria bacterium]